MKLYFLFIIIIIIASCANPNEPSGGQINNEEDMLAYGKNVYESQCLVCHGADGVSKMTATPNLKISKLNETEIGDQIFHGKNAMPAFKDKLGEPEINAVAKYVLSLKE